LSLATRRQKPALDAIRAERCRRVGGQTRCGDFRTAAAAFAIAAGGNAIERRLGLADVRAQAFGQAGGHRLLLHRIHARQAALRGLVEFDGRRGGGHARQFLAQTGEPVCQ